MLGHCLLDEVFCALFASFLIPSLGRNSVVGRTTRYRLDGPGILSRGGARFSAPVQTGPGVHPGSVTVGTGLFPGIKLSGIGVDPPHLAPSRAVPLLPLWAFMACSTVNWAQSFQTSNGMCGISYSRHQFFVRKYAFY